jgi:glycosyltransferase involved in cell wall biosynthesis
LETWLRAAALLARNSPKAQFVLVGEGKDTAYLEKLKRLAVDLQIGSQTYFPGYRSDLLPVYAAFDLFLLSSRREGLPNSILEAMAMGVPTVTTDVAGAKELVVDGATGYVLPQGDAKGLADALNAIAANRALRQKMAQASRERVEREFSFDNRLRQVEALYERVLGCRGAWRGRFRLSM